MRQHAGRRVVRHVVGHAGAGLGDGGFLRGHHQIVQLALGRREAAGDGEGAGDVGSIAVELAAGVDQAQVAVAQLGGAGAVMQHAGIGAGGDDRVIGDALRAVAAEFVEQLGFQVVLAQPFTRRAHGAHMGLGRDLGGAAHGDNLAGVLEQAHLVEDGADVDRRRWRGHAGTALHAHRFQPAPHLHVGAGVGGQRVGHHGVVGQQRRQQGVDLLDRMRFVEAEGRLRAFRAIAEAIPDLAFFVLGAAEQDAALGAGRLRHQDQHCLRLGEAGQVVEIAVVAIGIVAIAVAHGFRRGGQDRHAAAAGAQLLQHAGAPVATGEKEGGVGCGHVLGHVDGE